MADKGNATGKKAVPPALEQPARQSYRKPEIVKRANIKEVTFADFSSGNCVNWECTVEVPE